MNKNRRILVVDDQDDLRLQVQRTLEPKGARNEVSSLISQIRNRIGRRRVEPVAPESADGYVVDTVGQGKEAYELVKRSFSEHRPYAMMFLDMRMPPGWDGLETAARIRNIDKEIQIVIMTAFADHDQEEIAERLGEPDKLLYMKKPFHPEEIRQLALAMTEKWNLNRGEKERLILTNRLMRENSFLTRQGFKRLSRTYRSILNAFVSFLEARSGAIVRHQLPGGLVACAATSPKDGENLIARLEAKPELRDRTVVDEETGSVFLPLAFQGFRGTICLEGKTVVFAFDQLRPYLDILVETSREVLMNAFLLQQRSDEKSSSAVSTAVGKVAGRLGLDLEALRGIVAQWRELNPAGKERELVGELERATEDMMRFTTDLRQFSQPEPLARRQAPLAPVIHGALDDLAAAIRDARVKVETAVAEDLELNFDPAAIRLALFRLLANAVEALSVSTSPDRRLEVKAWETEDHDKVTISIEDNGVGVPDDLARVLFSPFTSGWQEAQLGLGATIARQVIEAHEGAVHFRSQPGEGTVFSIVLSKGP